MSDQKALGRRPSWDFFQTVSAPPVTLQYICLPEDQPKPGGREDLPFQKEPPASFGREGRPCVLGRSQGLQLRAPRQPWYADPGSVPTEPAPTCPGEREARERWERCSLHTSFRFQPAPGSFEVLGQKAWQSTDAEVFFSEPLGFGFFLSLSGRQTNINQKACTLEADKP